jgi:hypothetical protein
MTKLLLVSGHAQAGKTIVAGAIKEVLELNGKRVTILPFAGYLKFICKEHFGWDGKKDSAGRKVLQYVGTDVVRKRNPYFWVDVVAKFIETFQDDFDFVIVDDCRFLEEVNYFKDKVENLSIRVERTNFENSLTEEQRNHPSETALDDYDFDVYIYSESGLDNLNTALHEQFLDFESIKTWLEINE